MMLLAFALACGPKVPEAPPADRPLQLSLVSAGFEHENLELAISVHNPHARPVEFREMLFTAEDHHSAVASPRPLAPYQSTTMHYLLPVAPSWGPLHVSVIGKGDGAIGVLAFDVEPVGAHVH